MSHGGILRNRRTAAGVALTAAAAVGWLGLAAAHARPAAEAAAPATHVAPHPPAPPLPAAWTQASAGPAGVPTRLAIPAIGVDAAVESVGVTPQGNLDVPKDVADVGWYADGVRPGEPGDAVIDGHLDWYTGPAVFARLHRVRAGDVVEVELAGAGAVRYRVTRAVIYPADRPPADLFSRTGPARLTLITCAGRWDGRDYTERLVVDAERAGSDALPGAR